MAKAYSDDLRIRVMKAYDCGEKQCELAKRFNVSEKTIYLWRRQREERGHNKAITKYQNGHSHKILDLNKFKEFVTKNSQMTTNEMAKAWGNIGKTAIAKYLQKIGFTRKKRHLVIKTVMTNKGQSLKST
jgi:transposase